MCYRLPRPIYPLPSPLTYSIASFFHFLTHRRDTSAGAMSIQACFYCPQSIFTIMKSLPLLFPLLLEFMRPALHQIGWCPIAKSFPSVQFRAERPFRHNFLCGFKQSQTLVSASWAIFNGMQASRICVVKYRKSEESQDHCDWLLGRRGGGIEEFCFNCGLFRGI